MTRHNMFHQVLDERVVHLPGDHDSSECATPTATPGNESVRGDDLYEPTEHRTIDLTPSPSATFLLFARVLHSVAAELRSPRRVTAERRHAMARQVTYVAQEMGKWPEFLTDVTWEDLEAMRERATHDD